MSKEQKLYKLEYKQAGQVRRYGDSVYSGTMTTVEDLDESAAREMYRVARNISKQPDWYEEKIVSFRKIGPNTYSFQSERVYLD